MAIYLPTMNLGGAERVALKLLCGFDSRGIDVDLVLAAAAGPLLEEVPATVRVVDLQARKTHTAAWRLARYLRIARPAAVLSHMSFANVTALLARGFARSGARVVAVEHSHLSSAIEQGKISRTRQRLMRWLYPRADGVVAVSTGAASDLRRRLGLRPSFVQTIHNPVFDDQLLASASQTPNHPWMQQDEPPVLLAVGRLVADKDFATLLRSFAVLRRRRAVRLVILGEGGLRESLERLSCQLGISADVSMPGAVSNPAAYMRRASLLALSSVLEGLGIVLVEALGCGCPCVATDCPTGPREVLQNGRYGRLVPVGDVEALAEAMAQTLDAQVDRASLRRRAEDFGVEAAVSEYLELLGFEACSSSARAKRA